MFGGGALLYCNQCRAMHSDRTKASKKLSEPSCDKTNGDKCEVLQGKPYELHPDNWLPILIFEKALQFSPVEQMEGYNDGKHQIYTSRVLSLEAIRFVIESYLEDGEVEDMDYLLDGIAVLKGVQEEITRGKMG